MPTGSDGYTIGYTIPPWPEGTDMFARMHHRRPLNIGVIAGDLWMAHDR